MKKISHEEKIGAIVESAQEACKNLLSLELTHQKICGYVYTTSEAMEELGLDDELINELIEDYVVQIIKATPQFHKYITELYLAKKEHRELDYTPLRELVHKNLGVARNLRIKDAQTLLLEMMSHDDLEYLESCVEALRACSIRLKPECAHRAIECIEATNSL